MTALQYILKFYLFATVNGLFHLYHTNVTNTNDYKDCLYSFSTGSSIYEWQLVPYCIRHNVSSSDDDDQCYGDKHYTFEKLKSKNIGSHDMFKWNVPIDTINNYNKYLTGDDLSLFNHHYCNCSANWFGSHCQYSFDQSDRVDTFAEIITSQFERKQPLNEDYHIVNDPSMLTCYEGLQCHSVICLDWRQICNRILDCESGEDEPEECFQLETNECKHDEYRCRHGMCIPKTFLLDFDYDCMDLSDESELYQMWDDDFYCYSLPTIMCDFHLCNEDSFSCSDGQCAYLEYKVRPCNNGRDLFLRQTLLLSASTNNGHKLHNVSFDCWYLNLCVSGEINTKLFGYDYNKCECKLYFEDDNQCEKYFRKYCPMSFEFYNAAKSLYPFVRFLYHHRPTDSDKWWRPTHLCYNQSHCRVFPFVGLPLIDGLMCVKATDIEENFEDSGVLEIVFSVCSVPYTPVLIDDKRLFYCDKSMKYISKHRVQNFASDCHYNEDEGNYINVTMMRTLNLTDHFQCIENGQWLPRPMIGDGFCKDNSDTLYIGRCKTASDIACQFLRGLYLPPVHYVFQENCNGILKLRLTSTSETDETTSSCNEWPWPVIRPCDGYWDVSNGEDELNCSNTISAYITKTVLKCNINEHYCAYRNGTLGCLSKERAGDGIVDCLGETDERTTSCPSPYESFRCSNGKCLELFHLCDGCRACNHTHDSDDELMCPWLGRFECGITFTCKNGSVIIKTRQCDNVIDCQPDAEDEWLCDLIPRKIQQISLDKIEEYPLLIYSTNLTTVAQLNSSALLTVHGIQYKSADSFDDWFCNRGIIVTKRSSGVECFCPPSYYGAQCEYQSERLLITLRIDSPASLSGHHNRQNAIRLIARLINNDTIVHHEELLHVPLMKQMFYLNYKRPPPKQRENWFVRFDAFSITTFNVVFKASWLFDVPFSFLPVTRLVLHLILTDIDSCDTLTCVYGSCKKYLNSPQGEYCQCDENWSGKYCNVTSVRICAGGGKYIGRSSTPICACPLGRIGSECRVLFNPCSNIQCQHDGTCLAMDERQFPNFICSCRSGYYGYRCELVEAQIDIRFSESISAAHNRPLSTAVFVHFLELQDDSPGVLFVQNRLLYKQVPLNKPLLVFNNGHMYLSSFILLQIFFKPDNFDYYIAAIIKNRIINISTTIYKLNRCPYVDELLLNETVRGFPSIKKVKYYHRACQVSNAIKWFYDEAFLCFCDKDRRPDCLFFQRESTQCTKDYCQNNGRCVQNNFNGVWDFGCVCSGCAYGSLCQLTTSQYALSLDAMLGQDILENVPLADQPLLVKLVLTVIVLMLSLGFISNSLSFVTFKQPKVQEFGCGIYLFCLPLISQLGLSIFAGRFFYLLVTQIYNVDNRPAAHWGCISLEYFLTVCPMLFDWLTTCVAVERSVNMIKGVLFKKSDSVWWAKRVIVLLTIIILASAWYEPFIRQLIDDPRATTRHTWCVIKFPWSWLVYYRLMMNLINLIVPGLINLVATGYLMHKSTRMKQALVKKKSEKGYFTTFKKQLPLYGSPFGLVVLGLIRLIFSFTLVCITHQWQKYVYLTAYFISFVPLMGTFPIFVLPAKIYKTEFVNFYERAKRKLKMTRI